MLAKRLPSILPEMTFEESIETTKIHSVAGLLSEESALITRSPPFRAPHHTISPVGLSGGGSIPRPGEISLAHNGVLFLDELPEFSRDAMEVLRQPMEDGQVTISRIAGTLTYPCAMMVVAAMNPCPCGYFGHPVRECSCSAGAVSRYLALGIRPAFGPAGFACGGGAGGIPESGLHPGRKNLLPPFAAGSTRPAKFSRSGISLSASPAMPSFPPRRSIAFALWMTGPPPCCPGRLKPWGFLPGLMTAF